MWSRVADTKFIRDGRKFNLREGSLSSLAGHLIRADPPGPRPGTILAPLPCPRCPSWHRHTNLSIVAALWCPTRGQFGVLYVVELSPHICYHHTCSWKRNDARFRSFWGCPSCVGRGGVYVNVLISKSIVERHIAAAPRPGLGADPAYLFMFRRIPSSGWQL